jgi:hypothetical protein
MSELRLVKLFAWTIGVLILLWMLTECLGGPNDAIPDNEDLERDTRQYAADCGLTWQALDLVAEADHQNVDRVVDQIDALSTEIVDPNLKALAIGYARQTEELVAQVPPDDPPALDEARIEFRDTAAFDLALRCPVR